MLDFLFRYHAHIGFVYRMKAHAAAIVSDEQFAARAERWKIDTPDTKEAYLIRDIFDGETCPQLRGVND
jgi:hypothetical protein